MTHRQSPGSEWRSSIVRLPIGTIRMLAIALLAGTLLALASGHEPSMRRLVPGWHGWLPDRLQAREAISVRPATPAELELLYATYRSEASATASADSPEGWTVTARGFGFDCRVVAGSYGEAVSLTQVMAGASIWYTTKNFVLPHIRRRIGLPFPWFEPAGPTARAGPHISWPHLLGSAAVWSVVAAIPLTLTLRLRSVLRRIRGRCAYCGYRVTEGGGPCCPECGTAIRSIGPRSDSIQQ